MSMRNLVAVGFIPSMWSCRMGFILHDQRKGSSLGNMCYCPRIQFARRPCCQKASWYLHHEQSAAKVSVPALTCAGSIHTRSGVKKASADIATSDRAIYALTSNRLFP